MSRLTLSSVNAEHVANISSTHKEPEWLASMRRDALETYNRLPIETSSLYANYTDAKRMDLAKVMLDTAPSTDVPDLLKNRLEELAKSGSAYAVQIGSKIAHVHIPEKLASEGLVVSSISDALVSHTELVKSALESSDTCEDRFTALNVAAFDSGLLVSIPAGLNVNENIHLVVSLPEGGASTISRHIIHADTQSRASIVEEIYAPNADMGQSYIELVTSTVKSGAHLDVTTLQMMNERAVHFSTRRTAIEKDATSNWYFGMFGTMLARYRIDYDLIGEGASVNDSEVAFGNGAQCFDIQTCINHLAPSTEGRVTEKSILRDSSKSLFKGMIRIAENATKSNAYLSGRSILLDPDAKSDAIPGLEIATNDVKATHSASVAQIDDEQLFYLQARCMNRAESERIIVEGFLEPLSRKMSYQVRAWISSLVESKWSGHPLEINSDAELCKFVEIEETRYNEDAEIEQHYKYR